MKGAVQVRNGSKASRVMPGGFARADSTVEFFTRINALIDADSVVLDYGAGRGQAAEDQVEFRRRLRLLRGKVQKVIGVDIDEVVQENPTVDVAHLVQLDGEVPIADASVDLIMSDFTFEHIDRPGLVVKELDRVLRPGGWICARTPNKWGIIGIATRSVPNRLHVSALKTLQPAKQERDTFPTAYQLNTIGQLERWFSPAQYENYSYTFSSEPSYHGNSRLARVFLLSTERIAPEPFKNTLLAFMRKRPSALSPEGDERST